MVPVVSPPANLRRASGTKSCVETNARQVALPLLKSTYKKRRKRRDSENLRFFVTSWLIFFVYESCHRDLNKYGPLSIEDLDECEISG